MKYIYYVSTASGTPTTTQLTRSQLITETYSGLLWSTRQEGKTGNYYRQANHSTTWLTMDTFY